MGMLESRLNPEWQLFPSLLFLKRCCRQCPTAWEMERSERVYQAASASQIFSPPTPWVASETIAHSFTVLLMMFCWSSDLSGRVALMAQLSSLPSCPFRILRILYLFIFCRVIIEGSINKLSDHFARICSCIFKQVECCFAINCGGVLKQQVSCKHSFFIFNRNS